MPTIPVKLARCVDIPARGIGLTRVSCLSVRTAIIRSMLIWSARKSGGLPSRNITMRTLLIRQDWIGTGTLSVCPDVSSEEAKAARLARYGSRCGGVQTQAPALQPGVID